MCACVCVRACVVCVQLSQIGSIILQVVDGVNTLAMIEKFKVKSKVGLFVRHNVVCVTFQ